MAISVIADFRGELQGYSRLHDGFPQQISIFP